MSATQKDLVRRYLQRIWNERSLDTCDELIAEDFPENAAAPFAASAPGKVDGSSAMRATVEWLGAQFPDFRMEIEAILSEDDLVAARVLSTGTSLGRPRADSHRPGSRFAARQCHRFRITDGKLAEHWATRDDLSAMLQVGVIKRPRPPTAAASNAGPAV